MFTGTAGRHERFPNRFVRGLLIGRWGEDRSGGLVRVIGDEIEILPGQFAVAIAVEPGELDLAAGELAAPIEPL